MDAVKVRSGDPYADPVRDADIIRDALRLWARMSPYAIDGIEMWLLRTSRQLHAANPDKWAEAVRSFSSVAETVLPGAGVGDELQALVNRVASRAQHSQAKGAVSTRRPRRRRAP